MDREGNKEFSEGEICQVIEHTCMKMCMTRYLSKSQKIKIMYKVNQQTWPGTSPFYPEYFVETLDGLEGGLICAEALLRLEED